MATDLPATVTVTFSGNVIPLVNAFRIYPYTVPLAAPRGFTIEGAPTSSSTYTTVLNARSIIYTSKEWKEFITLRTPEKYASYRITVSDTADTRVAIYEFQYLICNAPSVISITYPETSYSFFSKYDQVGLMPSIFGLQNCESSPSLPTGLTLDANCYISGSSLAASPQTTYTITATTGTSSVQGTITFTFTDCSGTMVRILRTYRYDIESESFRIRNTENDDILLEVALGQTLPMYTDWVQYLCVTVDRFDVTLYSSSNVWAMNSFIYIYGLLPEGKEELLLKARYDSYQNNDHIFYLRRHSIHDSEQWYYKMGEVPANWFNENTADWQQASRTTFPESNNQIQLYKKIFNVASLSEVAGFILSIQYKYGCIVYLNGHEAWRNGVNGELTTSSTAENAYSELKYRVVTLPGRYVPKDSSQQVINFLQQGSNVIGIAIVAISPTTQKASLFDATVRLMTSEPEAHIWEFTGTMTNINGVATSPFNMDYRNVIEGYMCQDNSLIIVMDNDRREWVSSIQIQNDYQVNHKNPRQFKFYGRNTEEDQWTLIKEVTNLAYSMAGQKRRIYTTNNIPYNQFKFENFATGDTDCGWLVQSLNLYSENLFAELQPLNYPDSAIIFKSIEMSEIIPDSTGYGNFKITPTLPEGLVIDSESGWISGTTSTLLDPTPFTITADKYTGGEVTTVITLTVATCSGGRSLMTVRIRADDFPSENSWKLFTGRSTSGTPDRSVTSFPVSNSYYYLDFCLDDGIYTFQAIDAYGDGWGLNSGYTLTVDQGEMELDINEVASSETKPASVSTVFSTYFPFQIEYTDWKVYQSVNEVSNGWNSVSFDDSTWSTMKAANIPSTDAITTYIRKSFSISGVSDYQVMNVRVKYAGGVAAYLNGNLVARFNLAEDFDSNTESITIHDSTLFSKFHVILATAGIQEGSNVFAFEIHRPIGTSSSEAVVFDATGVFGVEDCSTVVDTFSILESSDLSGDALNVVMDLDPYTSNELSNTVGSYIEWTVENLIGSKWNSFNILGSPAAASWGFMINARLNSEDTDTIPILDVFNQTITDRVKPQLSAPVGLAGFRQFRWEVYTAADASMIIDSIHMAYCKASGSVCPGEGNYPSVGEGQISPSTCPDGYRGYSYRECSGGVLGEVKTDHCTQKPPTNPRYRQSRFVFVMGTEVSSGVPSVRNIVEKWSVDSDVILPAGLSLNAQTGEISGTPSSVQDLITYTIYAENQSGASKTEVSIQVRKGTCKAEGVFPVTEVGSVAVYECSSQGNYIGTQKCSCVLGAEDGVWESASGFCMSVVTLVILILVVIIIIAVIVVILIRVSKKKRVVGGVKGKKVAKKAPKSTPKKNAKV